MPGDEMQGSPEAVDTIAAVRKKLSVHRCELEGMQHAAYGQDVKTPVNVKSVSFNLERTTSSRPSSADINAGAALEALSELVLYTNPALTYLAILAGAVVLAAARYLMSPQRDWTLLSAACYLLLTELAVNFVRSMLSLAPDAGNWQGSGLTAAAVHAASRAVDWAAAAHDRFLTVRDPTQALRVTAALWGLAILSRYFSTWALATLAFVLAFTAPVALHTHRVAVSAAQARAAAVVKERLAALGLTRKQKALALLGIVVMLWFRSAWSTRCLGLLMAALAVRCNLKPAEVAAIRQHAEPLTLSVKKRAARLSLAASGFAQRTFRTPKVHFG